MIASPARWPQGVRALLAASSALFSCAAEDAGPNGAAMGGAPGRTECWAREERAADGTCRCPEDDVLCPTAGYAHFTISNIEGSGLPNEASYEVVNGLVRDRVTGLFWEETPSPDYSGWQEAKARCASLELGGRDDFRLPGRIELVTILDFNQVPVAASVFEDTMSDYHWTSSPASFVEGSAYSVYFGAGETTIAGADPGRALSRCVAGPIAEREPLRVEGELALDGATGLRWERSFAVPMPFDEAASRCTELGLRLPSIRELQSIVDENRYMPAIDLDLFPDVESEGFWSATFRGSEPWYVDFRDGQTYADFFREEALASRCVR